MSKLPSSDNFENEPLCAEGWTTPEYSGISLTPIPGIGIPDWLQLKAGDLVAVHTDSRGARWFVNGVEQSEP